MTTDAKLKSACRDKVKECLDRAELLQEQIQREKRAGKYHEVSRSTSVFIARGCES